MASICEDSAILQREGKVRFTAKAPRSRRRISVRGRALLRCLLLLLPVGNATAGGAAEASENASATYSRLAGTPVRVFEFSRPDVEIAFADFLATVPMTNGRLLPARLRRETLGAVKTRHRLAPVAPHYFVAVRVEESMVGPLSSTQRRRVLRRYGEAVYPQTTCPVFADPGTRDGPAMLSRASGLPRALFRSAPVDPEKLHRLFLLTEVSHCGFIAHTIHRAEVKQRLRDSTALRRVIEAVGDYEAIAAFRSRRQAADQPAGDRGVDEGDVLLAARTLSMFLQPRLTAYATIPPLMFHFDEGGLSRAILELDRSAEAVGHARRTLRRLMSLRQLPQDRAGLLALERTVSDSLALQPLSATDAKLLRLLAASIRILTARASNPLELPRFRTTRSETLPGVSAESEATRLAGFESFTSDG